MTFDEWWYKYGIEIDIPKNEACTIWMAALNNAEALKPDVQQLKRKITCSSPVRAGCVGLGRGGKCKLPRGRCTAQVISRV